MPAVNLSSSLSLRCACDDLQYRCDDFTNDYCTTNFTCFAAMTREPDGDVVTMGCIGALERAEMNCHIGAQSFVAIECCNNADFCNRNLVPRFTSDDSDNGQHSAVAVGRQFDPVLQQTLYILAGLLLLMIVVVVIAWRVLRVRSRRKMALLATKQQILSNNSAASSELKLSPIGDSTLKGLYEQSCTSGSGSGVPLLAQRTVASNIHLYEIIGKGRYGQVWRGAYQGENVAVKVFCSHAEATWWRECSIYSTVLLRHENILAFVAADTVSRTASSTQLWLVTRYHEYGSLYDYLHRHVLTCPTDMLQLLVSAAAGLAHLHAEIVGTQGKPAIAHRDVKSRNILVMSNRQCCIADLGMAILQRPPQHGVSPWSTGQNSDELRLAAANLRVGTRRCMAPEILDETINVNAFESYRQADVYSFALVVWETARRFVVAGVTEEYQPPYFDLVPNDPSFDDMYRIVCKAQLRPSLPNRWTTDPLMSSLCRLMKECWNAKPSARLPMLRLKKSLSRLTKSLDT